MDAEHFDALSRSLVDRGSRRRLVAAAGAFLGGLLASAPFDGAYDAVAGKGGGKKKKKKKKKKDEKEQPCDPLLIPLHCGPCHQPICLSGGYACVQPTQGSTPCGEYCCPPGQKCCGGQCIDQSWCCDNGAAKVPDCGQTCCPTGQQCCDGKGGAKVCWSQVQGCGACEQQCTDICCPVSKYCARCANYSYKCTATAGETC